MSGGVVTVRFAEPRIDRCGVCRGTGQMGVRYSDRLCTCCDGDGGWEAWDWQLATLAHNLAIAGALCEAHEIALNEAEEHRLYHEFGYRTAQCWHPGCGRPT